MSPLDDRIAAKRIRLEFGDHVGYSGGSGGWKRSIGLSPSGPICQMLEARPEALRRKSSERPLRDHDGWLDA